MNFFCSIYDGNPEEWTFNDPKNNVDADSEMEAALSILCDLNKDSESPIGPVRFFSDYQVWCLVCCWSCGRGVWPYIIVLHKDPIKDKVDEAKLLDILKKNGVNIELNVES